MAQDRFKARLYSEEKIVFIKGEPRTHSNRDGTLFSGNYSTKIIPSMLPEWYARGRYYKRWGYLSVKGITDMKYIPNRFTNHFLKDDFLLISYGGTLVEKEAPRGSTLDRYDGVDEFVFGNEILTILKGAREFSNYDITPIIEQIKDKVEMLAEKYPEDFGKDQWDFDADEYFSHGFDNGRKDDLLALNIGEKRYYGSYYEIKKYMDSLDREAFALYIEAFERTENGQIEVMVDNKPILEKITYISSRYQSIGIYENDPPIPPMIANGKPVTADKMYLFEMIAIENGRYMRLLKVDCDNLRYPDSEVLKEFAKDKYSLTYAALEETRVRLRSKLYVKEKEYANADVLNQGADRLRYDVSCFVKEIL